MQQKLKPIKYLGGMPPEIFSRSIDDIVAVGVAKGAVINILASLSEFALVITADNVTASSVAKDLQKYGKKIAVIPCREEVLVYSRAYSKEGVLQRLKALYDIITGGADIAVISAESLLRIFPSAERFKNCIIKIEKNKNYSLEKLFKRLVTAGYKREHMAESAGQFALRGDILDIYPVNGKPVRIDFFDICVQEIKYFDTETGKSYDTADSVEIAPATDFIVSDNEISAILQKIEKVPDGQKYSQRAQSIIADIIARGNSGDRSLYTLMPYTEGEKGISQYIPHNARIVFLDSKLISDKIEVAYKEHEARFNSLYSYGEVLSKSIEQYTARKAVLSQFEKFSRITFNAFESQTFYKARQTDFNISKTPKYNLNFELLKTDIKNWLYGGYKVYICGKDGQGIEEIEYALNQKPQTLVARSAESNKATVMPIEINEGFVCHQNKFVLIGYLDIFVKGKEKSVKRKKKDVFFSPVAGDYVVHEVHGIAICRGLKKLTTGRITKDYVVLEYKEGDILYVPCDQMDLIAKYSGFDKQPRLNRLGGREFERVKQRVKSNIKKMAFDLKELYAQREKRKGFAFSADTSMQKNFEDSFEFEETEDQLQSAAEIKKDMESPRIMDRLLCGDVGYGKTEVALRAAFKAVLDGKQVALLAPTTILSQQHHNLCVKRFAHSGIRVEVINRFKSRAAQKEILENLKNGKIDLITGTHRLLSKDVKFKDLGLLIVDEEQRFGVEDKEKIKNINKDVDVLSLSATPIPRTLHMSLSGIRDISVIDTPPQQRLPVQTYVTQYSEGIVYDAVSRELARGGQVFILYNRTESIESFAVKINNIVPFAKVIIAHGQMKENQLEKAVENFYKGNADVLICTTIIENGIDIANVNTLIVYEADRLGLSQLYQLRGRVGRGNRLAHVYFTYMPQKVLTENAYKRLKAIMEYTEFGSGFKIALRDLEIRGAGNVLGSQQHGHIENVGYDMYLKLLRQSISDTQEEQAAELDIAADAYIPEKYIEDNAQRMRAYQKAASLEFDEKREFISELEDIYGQPPQSVLNLINIRLLKLASQAAHARHILIKGSSGVVTLKGLDVLQDDVMLDIIEKNKKNCTLKLAEDAQLLFNYKNLNAQTLIEVLTGFFKDIKDIKDKNKAK